MPLQTTSGWPRIAAVMEARAAALIALAVVVVAGTWHASRHSVTDEGSSRETAECMFLLDANGVPGFAWADTGELCGEYPHGPFANGADSTPTGRDTR